MAADDQEREWAGMGGTRWDSELIVGFLGGTGGRILRGLSLAAKGLFVKSVPEYGSTREESAKGLSVG
jgi:hypothetical protein